MSSGSSNLICMATLFVSLSQDEVLSDAVAADAPSMATGCRRGRPRVDTVSLAGGLRMGLFTAGAEIFTWSNLP
jgi:hypothetical protein